MAHRLLRDLEADGWERSDFPIICESCLGDNPYVRMTKANFDKECKVCLLDLEFGLPVQVRDTAMGISSDTIPRSDVNREYFAEQQDNLAHAGADFESLYGRSKPNDLILQLQRTTPYYRRNRAHICSFYVRGECTRGAECPYRHEMPITGELSQQNIKDRYYGVNDPVANKLFRKAGEMSLLTPPEDDSITTLYIGGLDQRISEEDLKSNFQSHGEIQSIRLVPNRACAFITYTSRQGAEKAAEACANKLVIKGLRLKLMWGRPQVPKLEEGKGEDDEDGEGRGSILGAGGAGILGSGAAASTSGSGASSQTGASSLPSTSLPALTHGGLLPRAVMPVQQQQPPQQQHQPPPPSLPPPVNYFNIPPPPPPLGLPGSDKSYYPSMDPQRMGAVTPSSNGAAASSSAPEGGGGSGPAAAPPPPGSVVFQPADQQQQANFAGPFYPFVPFMVFPSSAPGSQQHQQQPFRPVQHLFQSHLPPQPLGPGNEYMMQGGLVQGMPGPMGPPPPSLPPPRLGGNGQFQQGNQAPGPPPQQVFQNPY
ncbi:hypothetical protein CBR_g479 [Chara braunii]|uniref:Uncharacterized protein n=1 Tax=Chara braunii TaxID=69332 RepID=A0A388KBA3_CHABU|nr:hypothetical protein CBR_g479 [Chara braunii]|eukprot:GBG67342.1 hypothetical protein CBR_g479 [Chara braunii]